MGKQRLVGTVVLVALAVIFIPMILDFSREQETMVAVDIEIPPAPDANKMRILPLDSWSKKIDPEVKAEPLFVESPVVPDEEEKKPDLGLESELKSKLKEAVSTTAPKMSQPDVFVEPPAETKKIAKKGPAWVVQIGSFSSQDKALFFRDQLRSQGYASYVVSADSRENKKYYRVRVGPVLLKSEASSIQKKLKTDTKLDGFLMRY